MTRLFDNTRCVEGRRLRYDPAPDDPYFEMDIGECDECGGLGCDEHQSILDQFDLHEAICERQVRS